MTPVKIILPAFFLMGLPVLVAQDLPPGLPPELAIPNPNTNPNPAPQPNPAPAPVPVPAVPAPVPAPGQAGSGVPAAPARPADAAPLASRVPVPVRVPVEHYQSLWDRSPFELSIQTANAAPTGIAADWLLASLSRSGGKPVAILVNKTTNEVAVVKTEKNGSHGMVLVSADIQSNYRQSKVRISRGAEQAELIFQEQDLASMAALAPVNPAVPSTGAVPPGLPGNVPGTRSISSTSSTSSTSGNANAPKPPRRLIIRPKPVTPPPNP